MGIREINRSLDDHAKQTENSVKPRDFVRSASSQGQKPEKLQLASKCTPEYPILPGGMLHWWRGNARHDGEASTSRDTRAQDSDQMSASELVEWDGDRASTSGNTHARDSDQISASEQVDWCVRGKLAEALESSGDRTFITGIKDIFRNPQIAECVRGGVLDVIVRSGHAAEFKDEIMQIVKDGQENGYVRSSGLDAISCSRCASEFKEEIMQIVINRQEDYRVRRSGLNSIGYSKCASEFKEEIMQIVRDSQEDRYVRESGLNSILMSRCLGKFKEDIIQDNVTYYKYAIYNILNEIKQSRYIEEFKSGNYKRANLTRVL